MKLDAFSTLHAGCFMRTPSYAEYFNFNLYECRTGMHDLCVRGAMGNWAGRGGAWHGNGSFGYFLTPFGLSCCCCWRVKGAASFDCGKWMNYFLVGQRETETFAGFVIVIPRNSLHQRVHEAYQKSWAEAAAHRGIGIGIGLTRSLSELELTNLLVSFL